MQLAFVNLAPEQRFEQQNILLPVIFRAKAYRKWGMARMMNGIDLDGVQMDEPNYARDLLTASFDESDVFISLPDDKCINTRKTWRLILAELVSSCDWLGGQGLLPFIESPQGHKICRACSFNRSDSNAYAPFSFNREPAEGEDPLWQPREWPAVQAALKEARETSSKKRRAEIFKEQGFNKLYYAQDPEQLPFSFPLQMPHDNFHVFADGLLRSHAAWLFYVLFKMGLTLDDVNYEIRRYAYWPADVVIPPLHSNLQEGTAGRKPKSSRCLRMTGSQVSHFTIHSVNLLTPLLTDRMRLNPAWVSWVKLVQLYIVTIKHSNTVDDVDMIDDLQFEYSELFDTVPEFVGLKRPKHHMLIHLATELWRYGPARGYWTMPFEAFNKVIKAGAQSSNWKHESRSVAHYWMMKWGRYLAGGSF